MKTVMHELVEELKILRGFGIKISDEYIAGLLEKEKEQILKAHLNGQSEFDVLSYTEFNKDLAEEYYNQTYNQNK